LSPAEEQELQTQREEEVPGLAREMWVLAQRYVDSIITDTGMEGIDKKLTVELLSVTSKLAGFDKFLSMLNELLGSSASLGDCNREEVVSDHATVLFTELATLSYVRHYPKYPKVVASFGKLANLLIEHLYMKYRECLRKALQAQAEGQVNK